MNKTRTRMQLIRWAECPERGRTSPFHGEKGKVRIRRILPVPAHSSGGRLTERTPAVQPRRREGVKVPLSDHLTAATRIGLGRWEAAIRFPGIGSAEVCYCVDWQRRTGTLFSIVAFFEHGAVNVLAGDRGSSPATRSSDGF
jgi:hypothetical protein